MLLFYFYISCAFLYTRHQQVAKVRHTPNDPGKVMQVLSVTRGKDPKMRVYKGKEKKSRGLTDAPSSSQRVRLMSLTPRTAGKLMLYPRLKFQIGREAHANVGSCVSAL